LRDAELLCTPEVVTETLDRMATAITARLRACDPLVLLVMNGALIPGAQLFMRLNFPCQIDHIHVSRYRGMSHGGELRWLNRSSIPVKGRVILVVDDILDEGITLKAVLKDLRRSGIKKIYSAVLMNKIHDRKVPDLDVDFIGLEVEDRYVFGCGMDYRGYWRNLPGVYALKNDSLSP
jgi:hypoxanthine phosphoribosyltransferase